MLCGGERGVGCVVLRDELDQEYHDRLHSLEAEREQVEQFKAELELRRDRFARERLETVRSLSEGIYGDHPLDMKLQAQIDEVHVLGVRAQAELEKEIETQTKRIKSLEKSVGHAQAEYKQSVAQLTESQKMKKEGGDGEYSDK